MKTERRFNQIRKNLLADLDEKFKEPKDEFERGREYENKYSSMNLHRFMGYGTLIGGLIFIIPAIVLKNMNILYSGLFLLAFSVLSLYLAHSEKKELGVK